MTQPPRTLLVVRSHKADAETLDAYDRYAAVGTMDVVLCCDERFGAVDPGGRDKIGYDLEKLQELGLFAHPKCGWRCGDYAYYVTRAARPDYDVYWMVEPDVLINSADLRATFDAMNHGDADLLAARVGPRDHRWGWHRTMSAAYSDVYGCIFPITRLSGRAIDHLHQARRAALAPDAEDIKSSWPNDEVFVTTELMHHGFVCRDLGEQHAGLFTRDSLRVGKPYARVKLLAQPPDGLIYHPVRDLGMWMDARESAVAADVHRGAGPAAATAHFRVLFDIARLSLEHEEMSDAALLPLMLMRPVEAASLPPDLARKQPRTRVWLRRSFGANEDRALAAAHPVAGLGEQLGAVAAAADFVLGEAVALRRVPASRIIPYAFDFAAETLLVTVHPKPQAVLRAASVMNEQRRTATIACVIPWSSLRRLKLHPDPDRKLRIVPEPAPAPAPEPGSEPGPHSGHAAAPDGAISCPPALTQLTTLRGALQALPPGLQRILVRSALVVPANATIIVSGEEAALIRHFAKALPELAAPTRAMPSPPHAQPASCSPPHE